MNGLGIKDNAMSVLHSIVDTELAFKMSTKHNIPVMDVFVSVEQETFLDAKSQQHYPSDTFRKYKITKHSCFIMTNFAVVGFNLLIIFVHH